MPSICFEQPNTQIDFANALKEIRAVYLQDALSSTVASMDIDKIDHELHTYADKNSLKALAAHGMRGELLFAVPALFVANPYLLGYYRLLLGYSQKGFYTAVTGAGMFKSLEERGTISKRQLEALPDLCKALNISAKYMLDRFDSDLVSATFFDQLTLLTLGPQLRGGANVQRGTTAISQVFDVIFKIVKPAVIHSEPRCIVLKNKSGRTVNIQFAADPDIVIREELATDFFKNLVAIEVKGGQDYSNIHNRVGEAEKSHQKAKKDGYVECWTVVNVDRIDMAMARKESPTTNRFYRISELIDSTSLEHRDFSLQILSIVGI
ncbi:MAG: XcyI family restriction endonuclease [Planctomycetia bacterium]|nr:XcyI family restriction endonuclease [Planctomycetia bacterium]